ncbi:hypothetical protein OE88DRAFT_1656745 [Heliocybe sulcata]|uniref:Uncharacterized protein n=1 Tax=Heliocybe sulcata TaxID=5364 RepID=A0A5C3N5B9_9AGAM|nr:hypothetical protein OE88DRAFT_1656745 [Heliocybe sulcata]
MVLQNHNVSKPLPPDAEDQPAVKGPEDSRLPRAIREASRRRRARANAGSAAAKYALEQAMRRSRTRSSPQQLRLEMPRAQPPVSDTELVEPDQKPRPKPVPIPRETVTLPRFLERPDYKDIPTQNIVAIEPGLVETPIDYLRDGLEVEGPKMLHTLNAMKPVPLESVLPSEVSVEIKDAASDLPTHMFAVFGRQPFAKGAPKVNKQKVTLYPVHDIIFASHCAHLPKLRTSKPQKENVKLPVVPVCLPSPQTFPILSSYLYTKRVDILLSALLPAPPASLSGPLGLTSVDETIPDDFFKAQKIAYAHQVSKTFTARALLQNAMVINGVWRNVCALGVFDDRLWSAMDFAWDACLTALAFATGNPKAMIATPVEREIAAAVL